MHEEKTMDVKQRNQHAAPKHNVNKRPYQAPTLFKVPVGTATLSGGNLGFSEYHAVLSTNYHS